MTNYTKKQEYKQGGKTEIFYFNDRGGFHRIDGPAIESSSGYKAWYINGVRMDDEKEFLDIKITLLIKEVLENP